MVSEAMGLCVVGATMLVGLTIAYGVYLRSRSQLVATAAWGRLRRSANWLLGLNGVFLFGLLAWSVMALVAPGQAWAQGEQGPTAVVAVGEGLRQGLGFLGAGLATGCASIGAGIGVGIAGAAGIGALSEKPEMLGKSLIYVGLAEGVAIYGLLISFMILNRLG